MSRQTGVFSAAVAVVFALIAMVLLSPRTPASALTDTSMVDRSNGRQSTSGSTGPGHLAAPANGSWSHGISFDQFTRKVEQRAAVASIATSRPTSIPATPIVSSVSIQDVAPTAVATSAPLPASGRMASTLSSTVPAEIRRWEPSIVKYALENGLDPNLVAAMIMTESQGNPNAISSHGAVGLMQVVNGTAEPDANIAQGTKIIAANLQRFSGDLELGLAAYNAGTGAVDRFGGIPPYLETETYIYLVLNRYYSYQTG